MARPSLGARSQPLVLRSLLSFAAPPHCGSFASSVRGDALAIGCAGARTGDACIQFAGRSAGSAGHGSGAGKRAASLVWCLGIASDDVLWSVTPIVQLNPHDPDECHPSLPTRGSRPDTTFATLTALRPRATVATRARMISPRRPHVSEAVTWSTIWPSPGASCAEVH